jgi:hypothetical protein
MGEGTTRSNSLQASAGESGGRTKRVRESSNHGGECEARGEEGERARAGQAHRVAPLGCIRSQPDTLSISLSRRN